MRRLGRKVRASHNSHAEGKAVKCEICDERFANSAELEKHKEREHPMGAGDEDREKPALLKEQEQRAPIIPGKNKSVRLLTGSKTGGASSARRSSLFYATLP